MESTRSFTNITRKPGSLLVRFLIKFGFFGLALVHGQTEVSFETLGFLPGGGNNDRSEAVAVSGDGSVIIGYSNVNVGGISKPRCFLWNSGTMGQAFVQHSDRAQYPMDVTDDGTVVVGYVAPNLNNEGGFALINGVLKGLGDLALSSQGMECRAISADGSTIVGQWSSESCYYSDATKQISMMGFLPGTSQSVATDVSGDGSVIVGECNNKAFKWENGTMTDLGLLEGSSKSNGPSVSRDGSTITVNSNIGGWVLRNGQVTPVADSYMIYGISADGTKVVGTSNTLKAMLWSESSGWQGEALNDLLDGIGLDRQGFDFRSAYGISSDGTTIVGFGMWPDKKVEAFSLRITGGESAPPVWGGYTIANQVGDVDTGMWMGWINVTHGSYVWSYVMSCYLYCPEENITDTGAWVYLPR